MEESKVNKKSTIDQWKSYQLKRKKDNKENLGNQEFQSIQQIKDPLKSYFNILQSNNFQSINQNTLYDPFISGINQNTSIDNTHKMETVEPRFSINCSSIHQQQNEDFGSILQKQQNSIPNFHNKKKQNLQISNKIQSYLMNSKKNIRSTCSAKVQPQLTSIRQLAYEQKKHSKIHDTKDSNSFQANYINETDKVAKTTNQQTAARTLQGTANLNKEFIISIIENHASQVGIAMYNINTGEFVLSQIIDRLTYVYTLQTIFRFYPSEIIMSITFKNSLLSNKLEEFFRNTKFTYIKRNMFDETMGRDIFLDTRLSQLYNCDALYVSLAAFNALINYIEQNHSIQFQYSSLNIELHFMENIMTYDMQTLIDFEILFNTYDFTNNQSLIKLFKCQTTGGTRMLRANLIQPMNDKSKINQRLDALEELLTKKQQLVQLQDQISNFKDTENLTVKFIQKPKEKSQKSIKLYIQYLLTLAKLLNHVDQLVIYLSSLDLQNDIFKQLYTHLTDPKITNLKNIMEYYMDYNVLQSEENSLKNEKYKIYFFIKSDLNDFLQIARKAYKISIDNALNRFESYKQSLESVQLKLCYNDDRGYYLSLNQCVFEQNGWSFEVISQKINQAIIQINKKNKCYTFTTHEMLSLNNRLFESSREVLKYSEQLLHEMLEKIQKELNILFLLNSQISLVDMILSFSEFVLKQKYTSIRPSFEDKFLLHQSSIHPILQQKEGYVVSQDIQASQLNNIQIIFSESSNGKTTILKQIGIIQIMAQIGCYVPCQKAILPIIDIILTKFNLNDNIESSDSGFSSELKQINGIFLNLINQNDKKSLILIDEMVNNSAHEDNLAISMASLEKMMELQKFQGFIIYASKQNELIQYFQNYKNIEILQLNNNKKLVNWNLDSLSINKQEIQILKAYQSLPQNLLRNMIETLKIVKKDYKELNLNQESQIINNYFQVAKQCLKDIMETIHNNKINEEEKTKIFQQIKNQCLK